MRVLIGADHGGFEMKKFLKRVLEEEGYEVVDVGNQQQEDEDDYVDFGKVLAKELVNKPEDRGILLCRNGMGMTIIANRYKGIRCGLGFDEEAVRRGRADDNINVLALPADYIDNDKAKRLVDIFLSEKFTYKDKYVRRIRKLDEE